MNGKFENKVNTLDLLNRQIFICKQCPRLVKWREKVAKEKTARFMQWNYWGKPISGFGDINARLVIVGLAPAAHGANRTGRIFTGDRSGDFLYSTLYKFKFSNQPTSESISDGLKLKDCYITAVVRCAPPMNKPLRTEIKKCSRFLLSEFQLLERCNVIVALGKIAFDAVIDTCNELDWIKFSNRPKFGHGNIFRISEQHTIVASYHPSQQNTFTGRLTRKMFEDVFYKTRRLLAGRK